MPRQAFPLLNMPAFAGHTTGRETLASSGSYTPASGRTPSSHRTNRLGSRAMRPSQCIDARSRRLNRLNFRCAHPCESLIEVTEHLNALRAVKPPIVVHPSPHRRVGQASQILQTLIVPGGRHSPLANGLPDRLGGLVADRLWRDNLDGKKQRQTGWPFWRSRRSDDCRGATITQALFRGDVVLIVAARQSA